MHGGDALAVAYGDMAHYGQQLRFQLVRVRVSNYGSAVINAGRRHSPFRSHAHGAAFIRLLAHNFNCCCCSILHTVDRRHTAFRYRHSSTLIDIGTPRGRYADIATVNISRDIPAHSIFTSLRDIVRLASAFAFATITRQAGRH